MSVRGDIEELLKLWDKFSFGGKLFLVLSTLLSATSIADIASSVIKWKAFFKEFVDFYSSYLVLPIIDFFSLFEIDVSKNAVSAFIVYTVCLRVVVLLTPFEASSPFGKFYKKVNYIIFFLLCTFGGFCIGYVWSVIVGYFPFEIEIKALLTVYLGFMMCSPLIYDRRGLKFKKAVLLLNSPFLIVAILAGINKGLLA